MYPFNMRKTEHWMVIQYWASGA